jgi:hypothetical protein
MPNLCPDKLGGFVLQIHFPPTHRAWRVQVLSRFLRNDIPGISRCVAFVGVSARTLSGNVLFL